jgi:hypothetical protein
MISSKASARGRGAGDRLPTGKDARRGELPEMERTGDLWATTTTLGPEPLNAPPAVGGELRRSFGGQGRASRRRKQGRAVRTVAAARAPHCL